MNRQIITSVLIHAVITAVSTANADAVDVDSLNLQRQGFVAGREALRTGAFECTVVHSVADRNRATESISKVKCWFDFPRGRFRFERTEPKVFDGTNEDDFHAWRGWIRNESAQLLWANRKLIRYAPSAPLEKFLTVQAFDIRLIGLLELRQLLRPTTEVMDFSTQTKSFLVVKNGSLKETETLGDTNRYTWEVSGKLAGFFVQRTVTSNRFPVPVESSIYVQENNGSTFSFSRSATEWEHRNGVDVPSRCQLTDRELSEERYPESLLLSFKWHDVNSEISPAVFDETAWELPRFTQVFSFRNNNAILEKVIGVPDALAAVQIAQANEHENVVNEPNIYSSSSRRTWLLIGNVALFVALIFSFVISRRARNRR